MPRAGATRWAAALALCALLCVCAGCGGSSLVTSPDAPAVATDPTPALSSDEPPTMVELERLLRAELRDLGIDPDRPVASAPGVRNEVIDLTWALSDPDGEGAQPADGYALRWTERLIGDYNMDGLVAINDLTPIAVYWQQQVRYDAPYYHYGVEDFPTGDPEYDGDVEPGGPPSAESGAYNWRAARVDGNGNGLIDISDLTPIGQHFGEHLSGYRVYRRDPGELSFVALMDPQQPGQPLLVGRETINDGSGVDPRRPVRYSYHDQFVPEGEYEYRVVPYDATTDAEGPASLGGLGEASAVEAALTASVTQGPPPLDVLFDASSSTTLVGSIAAFQWDLNGDGIVDADTGANPMIAKTFTTVGAWQVSVDVYGTNGDSDVASVLISVTDSPVAKLHVLPDEHEVPLTVIFDASGSYDHDGEVVRFKWDMDGDGLFELDTGPVAQRILAFDEPGEAAVAVLVYDNYGAQDSTEIAHVLVDEYDEIEDNDTKAEAMPLGVFPVGSSLNQLGGGIGPLYYNGDEQDWFTFEVESGVTIAASLEFLHVDADLTLELYSASGSACLASSATQTDNEEINTRLARPGSYCLRVVRAEASAGGSALYTLSLHVNPLTYDEIENNDSALQAQDLGDISDTLLPGYWGSLGPGGYDGDDEDWYAFSVDLAAEYCVALHFFHEDADLELQLLAMDGESLIGAAHSVDDDEILTAALAPGTYLVRCYRYEGGNANYWLSVLFP